MSADPSCSVLTIAGVPAPELDPTAFVAAGAVIVVNVRLAARSSVIMPAKRGSPDARKRTAAPMPI